MRSEGGWCFEIAAGVVVGTPPRHRRADRLWCKCRRQNARATTAMQALDAQVALAYPTLCGGVAHACELVKPRDRYCTQATTRKPIQPVSEMKALDRDRW